MQALGDFMLIYQNNKDRQGGAVSVFAVGGALYPIGIEICGFELSIPVRV